MADSKATTPKLPTRSMEELIADQEADRKKLALFEINWKKDGPKKRSSREFVERKQKALNDLWVRIRDRYVQLMEGGFQGTEDEHIFEEMELQKEAMAQILEQAWEKSTVEPQAEQQEDAETDKLRVARKKSLLYLSMALEACADCSSSTDLTAKKAEANKNYLLECLRQFSSAHEKYLERYAGDPREMAREFVQLNIQVNELADDLRHLAGVKSEIRAPAIPQSSTASDPYLPDVPRQQTKPRESVSDPFQELLSRLVDEVKDLRKEPRSDIRLPSIEIPKFSGKPGGCDEWMEFHDLFSAMVDKKPLDNIIKMTLLKNHVVGDAASTIAHYSITGDNYQSAWDDLCRTYHNKKSLIMVLLKKLFDVKVIDSDSSRELKLLLDTFKNILHSLQNLDEPVKHWNSIVVFMMTQRLPVNTLSLWEQSCENSRDVPLLTNLEKFLESRIAALHAVEMRGSTSSKVDPVRRSVPKANDVCSICSCGHKSYMCPQFARMAMHERRDLLRKTQLCHVCLEQHSTVDCKSTYKCRKPQCGKKHHVLLHEERGGPVVNCSTAPNSRNALLPTAWIRVPDQRGHGHTFRALVDQGSMRSFVTEKLVQLINAKRSADSTVTRGLGGGEQKAKGAVTLQFTAAVDPKERFSVHALILPSLLSVNSSNYFDEFKDLQLADPQYFHPGPVDAILGADVYQAILLNDIIKDVVLAQKTHLGWILSGKAANNRGQEVTSAFCVTNSDEEPLETALKRFWETEEKIVHDDPETEYHEECERIYATTTTRTADGRYSCVLPLKTNFRLGRSRHSAVAQMHQLEKKFRKNPEFKRRYVQAMQDYLDQGHAVRVTVPESELVDRVEDGDNYRCCYLPHLAITKEQSTTTKTRIVFNASSKTSNGTSLNDNLLVGPVLQRDGVEKVTRFRLGELVIVCDITKMYRQIGIHQCHWPYQRFVWRQDELDRMQDFSLTTVTFGQASAPFTAVRTLKQLAVDEKKIFPVASSIVLNDCYVDDIHYGHHSVEGIIRGRDELISCLRSAGMELNKWASNNKNCLIDIPHELQDSSNPVKFMGIQWDHEEDLLSYLPVATSTGDTMTKRQLLSRIAKVYDPLGWIQPVIFLAKKLMQEVWKLDIGWSAQVPQNIVDSWLALIPSLMKIVEVKIPRWLGTHPSCIGELHGFSDASKHGYGCVIYWKLPGQQARIVLSKSRVAPIDPLTIPRLELRGALLLSEMMDKIVRAIDHNGDTYGWLDSKVVLHWITNPSGRRWSVYVRNRVATINGLCPLTKWSYVATKENPADLVSRGSTTENLLSSSLWFHGPSWLTAWTGHPDEEPTSHELDFSAEELEELVLCNVVAVSGRNEFLNDLLERFSSYDRLLRVLAVVLRFVQRLKKKVSNSDYFTTVDEIRTAETIIFNLAQRDEYGEEIACIQHGKDVPSKSKIAPLAPFLDSDGLLRVGGRIRNSSLTYEAKHPMLLPRGGPLMELIVRAVHEQCAHGGPTLTLARLRHKYWLIAGTRTVKRIIHQCVRCHRARPRPLLQKMGDLPSPRVNLSKPFGTTGLDFAGPFSVKWNHGRGTRTTKAYVCVFVCLAIKAVHLELVSDLSSESFIAALKRFVARRGPVAEIQSDNATNFVGAVRMLSEIQSRVATVGIKWSFIPPSAPHFGGLWEAGVKSLKTHMAKVMTSTIYTWEEFETMLCLIEMSLNSRPLCPLTDELDSLDALTPNHFVNGTYVVPVPEDGGSLSMRNRWELCTSQYQQVVDRFKQEYLSRLQSRPKWCKATSNLRVGQLVLIKEENLAATEWRMGRITEVHLGADGLVRVAKLKTRRGEITRPITKLSPLPVDNPDPN